MTDLENRLRGTLQQVATTTAVPPPPTVIGADGLRRRPGRRTTALLAALAIPAAGVVAAAGGALPGSLEETFSYPDDRSLGGSTLRRVGALPGPTGERFELWTRPGHSGGTCFLTALVPGDQPAGEPAQQVSSGAGFCGGDTDGASRPFGINGGGGDVTFQYDAGRATRAEVLLTDGTRLPALVAVGQVAGWVPGHRRDDALLVGYDATGATVGTVDLTPWNPPPAGLVAVHGQPGQR